MPDLGHELARVEFPFLTAAVLIALVAIIAVLTGLA
jgi:hypothetical protein